MSQPQETVEVLQDILRDLEELALKHKMNVLAEYINSWSMQIFLVDIHFDYLNTGIDAWKQGLHYGDLPDEEE